MSSINSGRVRGRAGVRVLLATTTILAIGFAAPASAQSFRQLDENGVDLTHGDFLMSFVEGSIGSGKQALELVRRNMSSQKPTQWDLTRLRRTGSGTGFTITVYRGGAYTDTFTGVGLSAKANGATLTAEFGGAYIYRGADGVTIRFADPTGGDAELPNTSFCGMFSSGDCDLLPTSMSTPGGPSILFDWDTYGMPDGSGGTSWEWRLKSVTSSAGYSITFNYASDDISTPSPSQAWRTRTSADFRNSAVGTAVLASVSYAYPSAGTVDVTDMAGGTWQLTATSIRRPGETTPGFSVSYSSGYVSAVVKDGITTNYSRTTVGTTGTMTVTDAQSHATVVASDLTIGRPAKVTDAAGKETSYTYDSYGRLTRVTAPEGNYVNYTYDTRGNVTLTRTVAKPGSGLADIVQTAYFEPSCTNPDTCNLPTYTIDPNGNRTDYTYTSSGLIETVKSPAALGGGVRPEARYSYSTSGLLTGVSTCQTTASCVGTADEIKTAIVYDVAGNPTSVTTGAGDNSLTSTTAYTYTAMGDVKTVDGPLAGTTDTTTYRYDAARRPTGVISADPDGAGALKRRAQKTTYDAAGRVTDVEIGTVTGTDDTAWAAFAPAQKMTTTWTSGRKSKDVLSAGGAAKQVVQYSYDSVGRLECAALRMNSAAWGSLPVSACTLGSEGSFGPDRITKTVYDVVGRPIQVTEAFGTADAAVAVAGSYTSNGQTATLVDGEGNKTTYEYDGFDRLSKTRFPSPTKGSGTSSTTDYEALVYDANGNVTSRRLRGYAADPTQHIDYSYDNLDRVTLKDLPGSEPDVSYTYDLLGRMTGASQTGHALTFGYDALGRNTSQGGPLGSISYQYDIAGRRTRTTWPDSFYVTYDHLVTGEVTAIRENGATSGVGVLATFGYDDLGRRTTLTRGNGTVTSYAYDDASRLATLGLDLAGTSADLTSGFTYNPASQIATQTRSNDAYAWPGYVNVDRSYMSNGLNQYSAAGSTSFTYDARGNLTGSGTDSFGYSSENLMTSGPGTTLTYDPGMRLFSTVAGSVTTRFQYDGSDLIAEYNAAGAMLRRYVHGPGRDEALVWYEGSGTGDRRFLLADERGSVVAVTDASGAVVTNGINSYDEYGIPAETNIGIFQYTGQAWIYSLGLYYYKTRMYSPSLGRFMQTDTAGLTDGMNLYRYSKNDPINLSDPTGMNAAGGSGPVCEVYWYRSHSHVEGYQGAWIPKYSCDRGVPWPALKPYAYQGGGGGSSPELRNEPCRRHSRWSGTGLWAGTSAEAGIVAAGGGYQKQWSTMTFSNGESATFTTSGGFVGGPGYGVSSPSTASEFSSTNGGIVVGGAIGFGGGVSLSNATNPSDLAGHANTWNLNFGFLGGSLSFGDNGIFSVNVGIAKGWGIDLSNYTTNTKIIGQTGC